MATIQPHIDYCLSVWGSCSQTDINAIQKLQNRAARIIKRCYDFTVRSYDLIKQSSFYIISERFIYANDTHLYSTRYASNNNLHVDKPQTI